MIHNILPVICNEINIFLKNEIGLEEDKILVSNILNQDGSLAFEGSNKLICTLINLEEVNLTGSGRMETPLASGGFTSGFKKINVELTTMFSAHFSGANYLEALKMISLVLTFFQRKAKFTPANTPLLSDNIEEIEVEHLSQELSELTGLWTMMGAKYMPSLLFKIKGVAFTDKTDFEHIPEVKGYTFKTN